MVKKQAPYLMTYRDVTVVVTPKRVKRLNLRVKTDGSVHMSVPLRVARQLIETFVRDKYDWILSAQRRVMGKPENTASPCQNGSVIRMFGENLTLVVCRGTKDNYIADDVLYLGVGDMDEERYPSLLEWALKRILMCAIEERFRTLAVQIGVSPTSYYVRRMKTRWGSCNTKTGRICFNLNLVHYPRACLHYVMVHELCHLVVPSHSAAFWELVERYYPDYKRARSVLNGK